MREIKTGTILLMIVLLFVAFCAGLYIGKQQKADGFVIVTQRQAPAQETAERKETEKTTQGTKPSVKATEKTAQSTASQTEESTEPTEPGDTRMNLNTATKEELMTLPGIGEVLAQRILDFRESYGPFQSVDDLDMVEGIGQKTIDKLRERVTVEEKE